MSFVIACVLYLIVHFLIVGTVFRVTGIQWWSFIIFFVLWGFVDTVIKGVSGKRASSSEGGYAKDDGSGDYPGEYTRNDSIGTSPGEKFVGDPQEAIKECTTALEVNPQDPDAYYKRGLAKEALGDLDGACDDFEASMDIEEMLDLEETENHKGTTEALPPPTDYSAPGDEPEPERKEAAAECLDCGAALPKGANFCIECGKRVAPHAPEPDLISNETQAAPEPTQTQPDPNPTERVELPPEQRDAKTQLAVAQLIKLGGAAVGQQRSGNARGYEKIKEQIVDVGNGLKESGGILLVDAAYSRLERQASGPIVREITLAWKDFDGIAGWYM